MNICQITPETYALLLSIAGVIIFVLFGVIIWAAKRLVNTVSELAKNVASLNATINERNHSCRARHAIIDHRLNSHSDDISKQLITLELLKERLKYISKVEGS